MVLENTKFKLILGLGNKDIKSALDAALLYAKAGVRFFDAAPEILPELQKALKKAKYNIDEFVLCASAACLGDIHGRKAHISETVCSGCMMCLKRCPEGAITKNKKTGKCEIDQKKCIGCSVCKNTANCYAISFEYGNNEINNLKKLINSGFMPDMTELHASVPDKKQIVKDFKEILSFYNGDISVCINKKQFPLEDAVKLLTELRGLHKIASCNCGDGKKSFKFYVQADGASMNGGAADSNSTLECILFAKELSNFGFDLIISGGTNINTPKMLDDFMETFSPNSKKPIIAYGTYARKIISGKSAKEAYNAAKELFDETMKDDTARDDRDSKCIFE